MAKIHGNLQGVRSSQIKQLEHLYQQQLSNGAISPELAEEMILLCQAIHQSICCYVNRRGQVLRVAVGSPMQTQLAESELPRRGQDRLSGIRCLVAQLQPPDPSTWIALLRQRWDALVVLQVADATNRRRTEAAEAASHQNHVFSAYLAHIVPDLEQPWVVETVELTSLYDQDFNAAVQDWERQIQAAGFNIAGSDATQSQQDRVLLVGVSLNSMSAQQFTDSMDELARLVESAGGEVVGVVQQHRSRPDPQTVVGRGKVEEITLEAQRLRANLVVFNQDISATQGRNLEEQIGIRVVDRTEVILDIFAQRARSQAGQLQVELAQLEYSLPRLRGRGQAMSRLGAGIGTRGPGETKLETERRTIQQRIAQLQQQVNQLQAHRARLRHQRERQQMPTVALVGYTNAGKSTLLNVLTQSEIYTADQLFATLDPTTRKLTITAPDSHQRSDLLLTDTVGFIHHLPPALMDAFRATLEELSEADALLHVVDLSHPAWQHHMQSVEEVLSELAVLPPALLLAFNKIDRADPDTLAQAQKIYPNALLISATKRLGLEVLRQRLGQLAGMADSALLPDDSVTAPT